VGGIERTGGSFRRRRALVVQLAVFLTLLMGACTRAGDDPDDEVATASTPSVTATPTPAPRPTSTRPKLRVLGHHRLGGGGFNADVWGLGEFAYVGNFGAKYEDTDCPAGGVKVVDVGNPRKPKVVSRLQNPANTAAEDVVVRHIETKAFTGDVATVGIQACGLREGPHPERFRGLQFFDVTDPKNPKELSRWSQPSQAPGCHEIDMIVTRGRAMAGCAFPFAHQMGGASPQAHDSGGDEVVVVDINNPRRPKKLFGWTLPVNPEAGFGCLPYNVGHNVRFSSNGKLLYVSYWDAGTPILNISKPRNPRLIGIVEKKPKDADGDNHSVAEAPGDLLIILHEDFSPAQPEGNFGGCGTRFGAWGQMRIYSIEKPGKPRFVGEFATENANRSRVARPRIYTVHNAEVVGRDQVFLSWYSDGVRWIDIAEPRKPKELASWVPPAGHDPHGFFPDEPLVWGVYPMPDSDLVLASDINSGLWVLQARGLEDRL
jgi:hypothetical protein